MWIILMTNRHGCGEAIKVLSFHSFAVDSMKRARHFRDKLAVDLYMQTGDAQRLKSQWVMTPVKLDGGKITLPGGEAVRS